MFETVLFFSLCEGVEVKLELVLVYDRLVLRGGIWEEFWPACSHELTWSAGSFFLRHLECLFPLWVCVVVGSAVLRPVFCLR
ncbi:MAG: hypothetical protein GY906_36170 [bacterium]|nr:hypothetical protein [bacterium]